MIFAQGGAHIEWISVTSRIDRRLVAACRKRRFRLRRVSCHLYRNRTEVIAVHLEEHSGGIEYGLGAVGAHHRGRKGECAHLEDVGVAEHFVEGPGVCGDSLVGVWSAAEVSPLVDGDGNRLRAKCGNES